MMGILSNYVDALETPFINIKELPRKTFAKIIEGLKKVGMGFKGLFLYSFSLNWVIFSLLVSYEAIGNLLIQKWSFLLKKCIFLILFAKLYIGMNFKH